MIDPGFTPSRLTLAIADLTIAVDLLAPAWTDGLRERYAAFQADDAAPAWQVTVALDPDLGDTGAAWVRHEGPRTIFRVAAFEGWIDLATQRATVCTPSEARAPSAVERTLAYILMQVLPREHTGLLLHASGIAMDGRGYVFTGPSGAGKTTVARLAQGYAEVLNDENVVVRAAPLLPRPPTPLPSGGDEAPGWNLESTPFWGTSTPPELIRRVNRCVPLAAIFTLAHTPDFRLTRLSPAEAVMALLGTEKVATERPESAAAWLTAAERLIATVPVYRLGFRPTAELWEFLATNDEGRTTKDES